MAYSNTTIPAGNTYVRIRFTLQQNGADQIGLDNFEIKETGVLSVSKPIIEGFKYGPNPTQNSVQLTANSVLEKAIVYNLLGQQVLVVTGSSSTMSLNLESLVNGVYNVKVFSGKNTQSIKVVKK